MKCIGNVVISGLVLILSAVYAHADNVKVVATFSILGDIVKHVGGDHVDVTVLVGPNGDAHEYEPTPKDNIALYRANMIVENGLNFETWLDKLYKASGTKATRLVASQGVKPREVEEEEHEEGGHKEEHGRHSDVDPHAWQNVKNVIVYTNNILNGLIKADPANQATYTANAAQYIQQLEALDQSIIKEVSSIKHRTIVTNHDALGYFADAYGFKVVGAVIPSATTEAEDPSARQTAELLDTIRANHVKVIFAENMANTKLANTLAKEANAMVGADLYTDALGEKGSDGDNYIRMMQHNVAMFIQYLK